MKENVLSMLLLVLLLSVLLDGFLLSKLREVLLTLRFGSRGKYVKKKKEKERMRALKLWDRLTLKPIAAECKRTDTARRLQKQYFGYAIFALVSDVLIVCVVCFEKLPMVWIWVGIILCKFVVMAIMRILLFRNGMIHGTTI